VSDERGSKPKLTDGVRRGDGELEIGGNKEPEGRADTDSHHTKHELLWLIGKVLGVSDALNIKEKEREVRG